MKNCRGGELRALESIIFAGGVGVSGASGVAAFELSLHYYLVFTK